MKQTRRPGTNVMLNARVPEDTMRALQALAEENDRSVSAEVRRAIRQYLAEVGAELSPGEVTAA